MHLTLHSLRKFVQQQLLQAIQDNGLELHYQPQFSLVARELQGIEALLRWHTKETGWLNPELVIEVAEQTELIIPLSEWTLRQALADFSRLYPLVPRLSINISVRYLQAVDLAEILQHMLREFSFTAQHIDIEITESVLFTDQPQMLARLQKLRELGISLSIDDFGTGFCNLGYLQQLPITALKIDRVFLKDAANRARAATLYRDILQLARNLDLRIVAEGVETAEQWHFLQLTFCHEAQGYWLAQPMPVAHLHPFLNRLSQPTLLAVAEPSYSLLP